jgi:Alginate export
MTRVRCFLARILPTVIFALALTSSAGAQQDVASSVTIALENQSVAAAAQVQAAPRPPVPNRLNEQLPEWLRLRGEFRERMEGGSGIGFQPVRDVYWLSRFRLTTTVTPSETLAFVVEAHDARVGSKSIGATGPLFRAPLDLRRAFADLGPAKGPVTMRLGRQDLGYGDQRLLGSTDWQNAARSFDGAKATFRIAAFSIDAFAASVVRILEDEFDRSGAGNRLAGVYATSPKLLRHATFEPYVLWTRLGTPQPGLVGTARLATMGTRLVGTPAAGLDYSAEVVVQRGTNIAGDVRAWASHWRLRESLPLLAAPRAIAEYNFASGDENPVDGVYGTFDPLYPSPHNKYGLADQIGWKNVRHLRGGVELTPIRRVSVAFNYHTWWVAERGDAVYAASGSVLARAVPGAASSHIGHEFDVGVTREITPQIQIGAGYAHVIAGQLLKQTTSGADRRYGYAMVNYVLLAER